MRVDAGTGPPLRVMLPRETGERARWGWVGWVCSAGTRVTRRAGVQESHGCVSPRVRRVPGRCV